jgi:hypothetical protein
VQRGRSLKIVPSEGLNAGADLFLEIPVRAGFDDLRANACRGQRRDEGDPCRDTSRGP